MFQEDLPPEKVAEIRDVFSLFDKDDSGDIDAMELNPDGLGWYYGSANLVTAGHSLSHWSHLVTVCHIGHILYQNLTQ